MCFGVRRGDEAPTPPNPALNLTYEPDLSAPGVDKADEIHAHYSIAAMLRNDLLFLNLL